MIAGLPWWFFLLAVFASSATSAGMQARAQAPAPTAPAPALATQPSGASALPEADPTLPLAPTEVLVHPGRLSAGSDAKGKPTAGDLVEMRITPPAGLGDGAKPQGAIGEQLQAGPVEWGNGRILWWRPLDAQSGTIVVGLTSYQPGPFAIKPIPFEKDGKPVFASSAATEEFGQSGGDKSKDDVYLPMGVGLPTWFLIGLAVFSLGLVLLGLNAVANWYKRRKAEAKALATAPRVLTPIEQFERVRQETDAKHLIEKDAFKPHYFALSDAAKRLLGQAYRFDAEERTTRELLRELEGLGVSAQLVGQWKAILDEMDVTKFTDQVPERAAAGSLSERLAEIVAASWSMSPAARELLLQQSQAASRKGGT